MPTIQWANYEKPLPEGYPVKNFQQNKYEWKQLKWSGGRLSYQEWSPWDGLHVKQRTFASEGGVRAFTDELIGQGFSLAREGSYPSGRTNYDTLRREIENYARNAYAHVSDSLRNEKMCGFALVSDSGAMTLGAMANTLERLETRDPALSREIAFYAVAEWPYDDDRRITPEFMNTMNSKRDWNVPFDRQVGFREHKRRFFNACTAALETLKAEGVFPDQSTEDFLVMFESMDDDPPGTKTFLRLNPRRLLDGYKRLWR